MGKAHTLARALRPRRSPASASGAARSRIDARLWDAETGKPIGEPLTGHSEGVSVLFPQHCEEKIYEKLISKNNLKKPLVIVCYVCDQALGVTGGDSD